MTTKIPAIPDPRDTLRCLTALKEVSDIRNGLIGQKDARGVYLDSFVTFRELENYILTNHTIFTALTVALTTAIGFGAPTELTISATGEIIVSGSNYFRFHTVDTNADAATDDLSLITGGHAGEMLLLKPAHADRSIVCKNGASLLLGTDFTMDNLQDAMLLVCLSLSVWHPLSKYNGGA